MPPGGDGFYYFSVYLYVQLGEYGRFDIQINGDVLCTAQGDQQEATGDGAQAACSAAAYALEGLYAIFFNTWIGRSQRISSKASIINSIYYGKY